MQMKIGTHVKWESQARGQYTTKEGKIVAIVKKRPANATALSYDPPFRIARQKFPGHKLMFDGWNIPSPTKNHVAYLVEVIISPKAKPRLYMPNPRKLEIIKEAL